MIRRRLGQVIAGLTAAVTLPVATLAIMAAPAAPAAIASNHRSAPMISQDPAADGTDVYAFPSPENNGTITFVYNTWPFEDPNAGPNYFKFDDNVLYAIKIDNNGDNKADITYEVRFKTSVKNPKTFLYNTGPVTSLDSANLNVSQTYTVTRVDASGRKDVATNVPVPPVNVGPKSTPNYGALAQASIAKLSTGGRVFAGQRADPFFVDISSLFDLLTIRKGFGNQGGGTNDLIGKNVQSIVLEVPINQLTADGSAVNSGDFGNKNAVIGVWATSSRQATQVLSPGSAANSGDWVQVSRLGNPLVNEVVIPLGIKDAFNALDPSNDVAAGALPLVQDPEPARLLKALYGVNVPPTPRDDLVAVFLTGIPGSVLGLPGGTAPMNVPAGASTASEMLRLNMATPPTPIGGLKSRLGALGGDLLGFPNGRRLEDDVVDIALRAVAGATYPLTHPGFTPDAAASVLGDGVDAPDPGTPLLATFPYLATPNRGFDFNTAAAAGFIRCSSGKVYRLNADQTVGAYVTDPTVIGNNAVLTASANFPQSGIDAICGPNH